MNWRPACSARVSDAVIAATYYLRVISVMYFTAPVTRVAAPGGAGAMLGTLACTLLVIVLSVWPGLAFRIADAADPLLRQAQPSVVAGLRIEAAATAAHDGDPAGRRQKGGD